MLYNVKYGNNDSEPIVFLHGFMGDQSSFLYLMKKLSKYFFCIAIDLPFHGKSILSLIKIKNFSDIADLVVHTLEKMGINYFNLYGYSMGGRVAQNICLSYPDKVKRLILESSSFGIKNDVERKKRYIEDKSLFSYINSKDNFLQFLKKWHDMPIFCTLTDTIINREIALKSKNSIDELKKAIEILSVGNHEFFPEKLKNIKIPILYLYGEKDEKYKEIILCVKKIISHIYVICLPNASHNIHVQYPNDILFLIKEVLKR